MTVLVQIVVQAFVGILFAWTNLIGGITSINNCQDLHVNTFKPSHNNVAAG